MAIKLNFKIVIAVVLLGMLAHVCEAKPWNPFAAKEQPSPPDGCTITKNQYGLEVSCTPNRYDPDNIFIDGNLREGSGFNAGPFPKGTYLVRNHYPHGFIMQKMRENELIVQKKDDEWIIHAGNRPSNFDLVIGNVTDDFYIIDIARENSTLLWDCDENSDCLFNEIRENEFVVEKKGNDFNFLHGNHSNIWNIVCDNITDGFYILEGNVESGEYLLTKNKFRKQYYDFTLIPEGSFVIKKQGQNWELLHGSIPNGIEMVKAGIPDGVYISMENIKKPSVVYGKNASTGFRATIGNKITA